ncbi:MAG: hemerythrin family protein [Desulfobacteraceae bacterium]|jgi:hemerythrin|nr:hemerythrin family protein [Desulfobacteraceae bacterium]
MDDNWTTKYLLNIDEIDKQHKVFFELWNKEINQVDMQDDTLLISVIEKLEAYLKGHLRYEEAILRKSDYEDLENHIAEHQFFIQKIEAFKQELSYHNPLLFEKTALFIKKWFLSHILQSDRKYRETVIAYLKNKSS